MKLRVLDLFSGIGGFSLGLERTGGFETVAFCEIEEYPRKVLAKHWPNVPIYTDVRELTGERLRADGIAVDVITGGFPCQDLSVAGKQAGIHGERSGLFGEIIRLARDLRPRYLILENVAALLTGDGGGWARHVFGSLAEIGFDAEWHVIPAGNLDGLSAGAPHRRERVWIVAYSVNNRPQDKRRAGIKQKSQKPAIGCDGWAISNTNNTGLEGGVQRKVTGEKASLVAAGCCENVADSLRSGRPGQGEPCQRCCEAATGEGQANHVEPERIGSERCAEPGMGLLAHGLHARLSRSEWLAEPGTGRVATCVPDRAKKLKALGNSVVPQIPEAIGYAILAMEEI